MFLPYQLSSSWGPLRMHSTSTYLGQPPPINLSSQDSSIMQTPGGGQKAVIWGPWPEQPFYNSKRQL